MALLSVAFLIETRTYSHCTYINGELISFEDDSAGKLISSVDAMNLKTGVAFGFLTAFAWLCVGELAWIAFLRIILTILSNPNNTIVKWLMLFD